MFSISKNEQETISRLQTLVEQIANESIAARDNFFIGFSGERSKQLPTLSYKKFSFILCRRLAG